MVPSFSWSVSFICMATGKERRKERRKEGKEKKKERKKCNLCFLKGKKRKREKQRKRIRTGYLGEP